METGKVEFAPDYKSQTRPALNAIFEQGMRRQRLKTEHARLKDAVVEASKRRRKAKTAAPADAGDYIRELHASMVAEHSAVDALIAFEAEHKIGE